MSFKRGSTATGIHAHNINHNIIVLKRILLSLMQKYALLYRYNALFGFLINIRQVQVMLQHCWASQMMHKGSEKHSPLSGSSALTWPSSLTTSNTMSTWMWLNHSLVYSSRASIQRMTLKPSNKLTAASSHLCSDSSFYKRHLWVQN